MLPPNAEKKLRAWIRSRHLICSGNFYLFETVEYSTLDNFSECVQALGGTVISVDLARKILIGKHRKVVLYRAKASINTPHHSLKEYWLYSGGFYTRFDERG
ncbi:hypothetical protein KR51_00012690 [Rubidibacter lacunae KORDI 51-2]|uniref:CpeR family transcriptional regulator n=1 Tax=Rubidibacter lacunae KORDI 51-2 TaxID=582515 RepID=U5DBN0_9CHRO|nr:hypothetical protein KR51_00012690 [Rubidibacter lacunae KORDI 51-2]